MSCRSAVDSCHQFQEGCWGTVVFSNHPFTRAPSKGQAMSAGGHNITGLAGVAQHGSFAASETARARLARAVASFGLHLPARVPRKSFLPKQRVGDKHSKSAACLIPPKVLEPCRRQFRVSDRVADIPMPKVILYRSRIVAIAGELVSGTMPQHVCMNLKGQSRLLTRPLHHQIEPLR